MNKKLALIFIIVFVLLVYSKRRGIENYYHKYKYLFFNGIDAFLDNETALYTYIPLDSNLNFDEPVSAMFISEMELLVAEKKGKVWYITNLGDSLYSRHLLIDISTEVDKRAMWGLTDVSLDLKTQRIFIHYRRIDECAVVSSFSFEPTRTSFSNDEVVLLDVADTGHTGGSLRFDKNGDLFISIGDKSKGIDDDSAQTLDNLNGSLLAIRPDSIDPRFYSIPLSNPFINSDKQICPEIYAYGFRNPYRFFIDTIDSNIWLGDVGLSRKEEINNVKKGGNYGWNSFEGTIQHNNKLISSSTHFAQLEYSHGWQGFSVVGGVIYRGRDLTQIQGHYIFGDYVSGKIWSLNRITNEKQKILDSPIGLTSFFTDHNGKLLFTNLLDGAIYEVIKKDD